MQAWARHGRSASATWLPSAALTAHSTPPSPHFAPSLPLSSFVSSCVQRGGEGPELALGEEDCLGSQRHPPEAGHSHLHSVVKALNYGPRVRTLVDETRGCLTKGSDKDDH